MIDYPLAPTTTTLKLQAEDHVQAGQQDDNVDGPWQGPASYDIYHDLDTKSDQVDKHRDVGHQSETSYVRTENNQVGQQDNNPEIAGEGKASYCVDHDLETNYDQVDDKIDVEHEYEASQDVNVTLDQLSEFNYDDAFTKRDWRALVSFDLIDRGMFLVGSFSNESIDNQQNIRIRFQARDQPGSDSSFELRFKFPTGPQTSTSATIILNKSNLDLHEALNIKTLLGLKAEDHEEYQKALKAFDLTDEHVTSARNPLTRIILPYNANNCYDIAMHSQRDHGIHNGIVTGIQEALEYEDLDIHVLVDYSTGPISHSIKVWRSMQYQKEHDAIRRYFGTDGQPYRADLPLFIQPNTLKPQASRPCHMEAPYKVAFESPQEYFFVTGLCHYYEHQAEHARLSVPFKPQNLVAFAMPGGEDNSYTCFIDIPLDQDAGIPPEYDAYGTPPLTPRLSKGDRLVLNFVETDHELFPDQNWTNCEVLSSSVVAHVNRITLVLKRPWDKVTGAWKAFTGDVVVTPMTSTTTVYEARQITRALGPNTVNIKLQSNQRPYKAQRKALIKLQERKDHENFQILTGSNMNGLRTSGLYDCLDLIDTTKAQFLQGFEQNNKFNEQQQMVWSNVSKLPGGVCLLEGPAGSGKTHTLIRLIMPLVCSESVNKPHQVLVTTASNTGVDELALKIHTTGLEERKRHNVNSEFIVVRLHAFDSEKDLLLKDTLDQQRTASGDSPPPRLADHEVDLLTDQMLAARFLREESRRADYRPLGVNDRRMRKLELSLAWWMSRVAGIGKNGTNDPIYDSRFNDLSEHLDQVAQDQEITADNKEEFSILMAGLRMHVIMVANVVVTTYHSCSDAKLYDWFVPRAIFVDEASRLSEAEAWTFWAWTTQTTARIFLGDSQQVTSYYESTTETNPFFHQSKHGVFSRLQSAGAFTVQFSRVHRSVPAISEMLSTIFYNGRLTFTETNQSEDATKALSFFKERFNHEGALLFLDIKDGVCQTLGASHSKFNQVEVQVVLTLLEDLLKFGYQPADIGIISPYIAQSAIFARGVAFLAQQYPKLNLNDLLHDTIDASQGKERKIGILSLTIGSKIGHLADSGRLNVGLSRFCHGLIVTGNLKSISTSQQVKRTKLVHHPQRRRRFETPVLICHQHGAQEDYSKNTYAMRYI